ncbi:PIG-L deacetylase family protein [Chitinasiproducens palmae]|uniref:N-acetylglucosaminyl deacetylase, LmbE family n=1 Tax=Chitinasiproducens palmae TaxID=1770053 RepID=A0A1H2PRP4_9BURK|nr:PIG-L family deacetylase [Chitinasiproducens palmae]SDV49128.1 N-acetylglucosaminyl deacetylase, LmbE family [Chitinasiproducens palmae]
MAETPDRLLLISPHYDDGIFSCGELLASHDDCVVVTVFTGVPSDPGLSTDWDRACGFRTSREAMVERQRENEAALDRVGAVSANLGFFDSQYEQTPSVEAVAAALVRAIDRYRPTCAVTPLGLFHSDHLLCADAALSAFERVPSIGTVAYEDALYRRMPTLAQRRLATLLARGIGATPAFVYETPGDRAPAAEADHRARWRQQKRSAVGAYTSQLKAFGSGGYDDVDAPEHYWHLRNIEANKDEA